MTTHDPPEPVGGEPRPGAAPPVGIGVPAFLAALMINRLMGDVR